jgi:hypothetical protein
VGAHKGLALLGDGNGGDARHMAVWHGFAVGEALNVSIHLARERGWVWMTAGDVSSQCIYM